MAIPPVGSMSSVVVTRGTVSTVAVIVWPLTASVKVCRLPIAGAVIALLLVPSVVVLPLSRRRTCTAPVAGMVYTFAISLHGSTISVSVNGTPRVTMVTDATLGAGGIGLIVNNGTVEFDNVLVTK